MKNIAFLFLLLLSLSAATCQEKGKVSEDLFNKTWLHSREEETGEIRIYRPNTYAFPPSRGRTGFSLTQDGTFKEYAIAPADGLEEHVGKWKLIKEGVIRVTFANPEWENYNLELVSFSTDLLKVKKVSVPK